MKNVTLRHKAYSFLEMGSFGGRGAAVFEGFMIFMILANVVSVALETVDSLWAVYHVWFRTFDYISVAIFSMEYVARVWAHAEHDTGRGHGPWRRRLRYMLSPLAIIDFLAIAPFYFGAFTTLDLRELRIFRLVRLLKLVRYSPALSSLARVLYAERQALLASMVITIGLEVFAASMMYSVEHKAQPEVFGSIPDALWWALVTFTTVGYGDAVPITVAGKVVGGIVMMLGFVFYAVPIGIIASGFSDELHRREFVVPVGVLEALPVIKDLPRDVAEELARRMRSISLVPGMVLTRRNDMDNGVYFILSGEIAAFYHHRAVPLLASDFLGECGIINDQGGQVAAVARSRCRLMWLDSTELQILQTLYPAFLTELRDYASERLIDMVEDGHLSAQEREEMISHYARWAGPAFAEP